MNIEKASADAFLIEACYRKI